MIWFADWLNFNRGQLIYIVIKDVVINNMKSKRESWFWAFQISVGSICLLLSVVFLIYGLASKYETTASAYIWLFLAGIGLIVLGAERLVSGILAKGVRRSSRLINIGAGVGLIVYIGSGFFYPEFATKWLIIFLALVY